MYAIESAPEVGKDLRKVPAYHRNIILDAIEKHLSRQPSATARNRKMLAALIPPFKASPPIWELRVGEYRVFYDVDEINRKVAIRAVRKKPPHRTTEDIL